MEDRTKTLPSSYREKKRYIIFEVISEQKIEFEELIKAVFSHTINLIGILGVAKTNFRFLHDLYDREKQRFVLRCLPKDVELIRFALSLITEINEKRVCIRSLGVTGTIKSARRKYLENFEY
ncbi:MAG: ribonuclease P protein component 2 [Candidatus Aenigmatarchaeota archaeon]|nr:MAG: ribonuclease P protein component 2 [Candidatus Aenigmarchaeota archaeon]